MKSIEEKSPEGQLANLRSMIEIAREFGGSGRDAAPFWEDMGKKLIEMLAPRLLGLTGAPLPTGQLPPGYVPPMNPGPATAQNNPDLIPDAQPNPHPVENPTPGNVNAPINVHAPIVPNLDQFIQTYTPVLFMGFGECDPYTLADLFLQKLPVNLQNDLDKVLSNPNCFAIVKSKLPPGVDDVWLSKFIEEITKLFYEDDSKPEELEQ